MKTNTNRGTTRRKFLQTSASTAAALAFTPYFSFGKTGGNELLKRSFGRIDFETTTMGLGGQASLQWTPDDVDPVPIILKAFKLGINYFDTSNLYGPSQANFGKAFKSLKLQPATAGYDEKLRKSIFLTSKTHLRWAKGMTEKEGVNNWTNGTPGTVTVDDLRRSLSLMFGDGKGNYPKGAYLDMMLIHNLNTIQEVDALYEGYKNTDAKADSIGALAALLDYRDGTNLTGLNPKEEKLIKHIGFSGHFSSPVMMEMIKRDTKNILDAMLVSINSNDKLNRNMQNNVIPVATAKNMGIIGMKVFADGAMFTKEAHWTQGPHEVVRTVGSKEVSSKPLIEYALTTAGIHNAIIGIGQISDDKTNCQLEQNLMAAQVKPKGLSITDREEVEKMTLEVKAGKTNYFQTTEKALTGVNNAKALPNDNSINIHWDSAYAGVNPIDHYDIYRGNKKIGTVKHKPQTTLDPFTFNDKKSPDSGEIYKVVTVDSAGMTAESIAKS